MRYATMVRFGGVLTFGAAALLGLALASSARADIIASPFKFDPDGTGIDAAIPNVTTFQWADANADGVGGNLAVANFLNGLTTTAALTFHTDYQAKLSQIFDGGNNSVTPSDFSGAGQTKELTVVARLTEKVVSVTGGVGGGTANFIVTPALGDFFEIYYGPKNANDKAGTGFNDGTLIYKSTTMATGQPSDSHFTVTDTPTPGHPIKLDAHGANDYPAIQSVLGGGGSVLLFSTVYTDPDFFKSGDPFLMNNLDASQNLNYSLVDPSAKFADVGNLNPLVPPVGSGPAPAEGGATIADLGSINGGLKFTAGAFVPSGKDVMFEVQASTVFVATASVPEPSTLLLSLLGLGGFGIVSLTRSRRRAAKA